MARAMVRLGLGAFAATFLVGACAEPASTGGGDEDLVQKPNEHWIYSGPLPPLESAKVTVSLAGHTARVSGLVPMAVSVPDLPHVRASTEGGRTRIDVVYPIATAGPSAGNSPAGVEYSFHQARPYRPDGMAYPASDPAGHFVTWGGFPFLAYNGGIAFHGPITFQNNRTDDKLSVWYLRRGRVSGGCNRMMGEHVVELAHVLGISMRRIYGPNKIYENPTAAKVVVTDAYDTIGDRFVDVDYPTDVGVTRPASVHGAAKVAMFGSWVASETPDGRDLPPDMKWEGGNSGTYYDFADHARRDMVCSFATETLSTLKALAALSGGELPRSICEKRACIVDAIARGANAASVRESCKL